MTRPHQNFVVHGPFPVPFESFGKGTSKRITRVHVQEFWAQPDLKPLHRKRGCYVFALANGRGFSPWYVGKTTKSFERESLGDHKLVYYNEVIYRGRKGKPVLFFVADETGGRAVPRKEIDGLETFLIQSAVFRNPQLKNQLKAGVPNWGIKGVVRGGRGNAPAGAKRFKSMMGL